MKNKNVFSDDQKDLMNLIKNEKGSQIGSDYIFGTIGNIVNCKIFNKCWKPKPDPIPQTNDRPLKPNRIFDDMGMWDDYFGQFKGLKKGSTFN